MANRMPGEIWSIRQQKDWNVGLSRKNNTRLSTATCTSSAKSMLLVAASKNANIRVVQTGQLAPFSIAKAKAVCTCFNHHSHRPSLPASGSPWSLKFLKQRVQKESEKEIQ